MKIVLALLITVIAGGVMWVLSQPDELVESYTSRGVPVISTLDILGATDLASGVKRAVDQNDADAIDKWLDKAIDLGLAANLPAQDLVYLRSERAKKYVIFHAKRHLFNDAVEQAYYALLDIEGIKAQYPEALDLFDDAEQLIADRNQLIQEIATELAKGEPVNDKTLLEAQQHWQQRFASATSTDSNKE